MSSVLAYLQSGLPVICSVKNSLTVKHRFPGYFLMPFLLSQPSLSQYIILILHPVSSFLSLSTLHFFPGCSSSFFFSTAFLISPFISIRPLFSAQLSGLSVSARQSNKNTAIESHVLLTTSFLSLNPSVFCLSPSESSFFSFPSKPCCTFWSADLNVTLQISPNYMLLCSCFSSLC